MCDLTLVVPCYREASHLKGSTARIIKVLDTTSFDYEIVFVDDCSPDGTRDVILELCRSWPRLSYIFHERNTGRGGAFKTGFRQAKGRVVGFIDVDCEVDPLYIPTLVMAVTDKGYDVATGHRHYLLRQVGQLHRVILSAGYQSMVRWLLNPYLKDTETGCKFFSRESTTEVVTGSRSDGWFWDTEVMVRASLAGMRILEQPVLFLRREDVTSTVRLFSDTKEYMRSVIKLRRELGLAVFDKSPVYWFPLLYDMMMRLLYRDQYEHVYQNVADLIEEGSSVVDVCAGTCKLYFQHLKQKSVAYTALDFNSRFMLAAKNRGADVRFFNLLTDTVPRADYVVMISSFCHFIDSTENILRKLRSAAKKAVILSEPVRNLSSNRFEVIARLANYLTNPGVGDYRKRYNLSSFRKFAESNRAEKVMYTEGGRNAIAVFAPSSDYPKRAMKSLSSTKNTRPSGDDYA